MLKVTIVERARSLNLVTLAKLKTSLGIEDTDSDTRLSELIEDVSSAVVEYCGKHFARTLVTEDLAGFGDLTLSLARTPVVRVDAVRFHEDLINASGYELADRDAGFLYRVDDVWTSTQPRRQWIESERVNAPGSQDWHVDYLGGYLMPEDDFIASGNLAVDDADNSFNISGAGEKFPLLAAGESIRFAGFSNAENNGTFTVVSRTTTKITVADTLIAESGGAVVMVTTNLPDNELKLPRDLQRIVIGEIRDRYASEQRDSSLTAEKIGDWSASYGGTSRSSSGGDNENTFGFSHSTMRALQRYIRVM